MLERIDPLSSIGSWGKVASRLRIVSRGILLISSLSIRMASCWILLRRRLIMRELSPAHYSLAFANLNYMLAIIGQILNKKRLPARSEI
ncbi:uncharacterized protein BDW43DRAFT_272135 [Aspergillus alliaceus]|uniref:uncharacterized protein n=1 Tax=Petromyces alliaceus TaxID=209559 RepID=UPI0012A52A2E|nr:uncharacterized protein BDW43DRAFT_272135 [Aspergillus alliaceus]KAB8235001.1 hypothetical protein BDW43DRAFT_272135 [Aspergillus alliaceus]